MPQSFPCIDPSPRPGVLFKGQKLDWRAANPTTAIQLPHPQLSCQPMANRAFLLLLPRLPSTVRGWGVRGREGEGHQVHYKLIW